MLVYVEVCEKMLSCHAIRITLDSLVQDLEPCALQCTSHITIWWTIPYQSIQRERVGRNGLFVHHGSPGRSTRDRHIGSIAIRSPSTVMVKHWRTSG
jgi:hypothetical protein